MSGLGILAKQLYYILRLIDATNAIIGMSSYIQQRLYKIILILWLLVNTISITIIVLTQLLTVEIGMVFRSIVGDPIRRTYFGFDFLYSVSTLK
jgi:hypothetical protein